MSAQKGRTLTPAQREARRRNGQKSTGPRTPTGKKIVSLNAVKQGMYSCPPIQTMAVLQENPIEEDRPLLREQALVDGLLVRKYKMLLEMQRERRRAEAEEGEVEWDLASLGLGRPEPEGGPDAGPELGPAALLEDDGKVDG